MKRTTNQTRIGHAGTLDPFAEGLMVVAIGRKYTREVHTLLTESRKEYLATIELGKTSDTFDITGAITEAESNTIPSCEDIVHAIEQSFLGDRLQTPPVYSAKKFGGKRLRDMATETHAPALAAERAKHVTLYEYEIISYNYPTLIIRLVVSSGYYIRTFGSELGTALGTGAYLTKLIRTRINEYTVAQALNPEDIDGGIIETTGTITGAVQGIGFRYFLQEHAHKLGISGTAQNLSDGSISFRAQGHLQQIAKFLTLAKQGPEGAHIDDHHFITRKPVGLLTDFTVF